MDLLPGQSIGRYHIIERLGEGGMAIVYKAYDTRLEREVAIKVIRVDQFPPASLENILKRFEREAKALARLNHPFIVHINDYGEEAGIPYLVMDYLPGGTLKTRLGQPMAWHESCKLLIPVAQALDYAHDQGLIHRDVKPSNILLTRKGQPMLTDFGIAKILDVDETTVLTGTGMGVGTPEYMAPEQWTGKTSLQTDIYALGVVLYEMVTGRKPYTADTPAAILLKQATEPLPPPRGFVPGLPDEVERVLFKALARKPEDRYASMEAFAQALDGISTGQRSVTVGTPLQEIDATINTSFVNEPTRQDLGHANPAITIHTPVPPVREPHQPQSAITKTKPQIQKYWPVAALLGGLALLVFYWIWQSNKTPLFTPTTASSQKSSPGIGSMLTREKDGMVVVYVPQGSFIMGSEKGDSDEKPMHSVTLDAFWIDRTDVTNAMYAQCVEDGVCAPPSSNSSFTRVSYYDNSQFADYPVIYVDWNQAKAYCEWANARLPTEAEWEKAARGTDDRIYPWGEDIDQNKANYYGSDTTNVGFYTKGASQYGALDMTGNVLQWVADWYGASYYQNSPSSNPLGPASGGYRVLRGSAWNNGVDSLRSADRNRNNPSSTNRNSGFRCAMDDN